MAASCGGIPWTLVQVYSGVRGLGYTGSGRPLFKFGEEVLQSKAEREQFCTRGTLGYWNEP